MRISGRTHHAATVLAQIGLSVGLLAVQPALAVDFARSVVVHIPPQSLASALVELGSQTGVQVMTDAVDVQDLSTAGVRGRMTLSAALRTLLRGTHLRFVDAGRDSVAVRRSQTSARPVDTAVSPAGSPRDPVGPAAAAVGHPQRNPPPRRARSRGNAAAHPEVLETVIVTGTHIAGVQSVSPVITIGRRQIDESGYSNVGAVLRALPENFSGGQNPGVLGAAAGTDQFSVSGASSANLMGLGADSTLTLVDGRRLAYDGFQNGVDLSMIPLAAVKRIEVMTGGGSAIYGSDAVAGVVNVILRHHYSGVTATARFGDVTEGSATQTQYSVLAGRNWNGGNLAVAYEYAHDAPLLASERPFARAADEPTWLLPELNRDSMFLTADQRVLPGVKASLEALYTVRSYSSRVSQAYGGQGFLYLADTRVHEYGVSPEVRIALPLRWSLTLSGTLSSDRDHVSSPTFDQQTGALLQSSTTSYTNTLRVGELDANGPVLRLPSGLVRLAVGLGYRSDQFKNLVPGFATLNAIGSRNDRYAYAELNAPLVSPRASRTMLERLDFDAAFRYEDYSDFGSQGAPRFGVVYRPVQAVDLRASWSRSFMAPELLYAYGPQLAYLEPSTAFSGTPGTTALLADGSNPALQAERATSETVSMDITPRSYRSLTITPTYFQIHYTNRIVAPITAFTGTIPNPIYAPFIIDNPSAAVQQSLIGRSVDFVDQAGVPYDAGNVAYLINDEYQNATLQDIHGIDLTVSDGWPMLGGRLEVDVNGAWLSLKQQDVAGEPLTRLSGTIFNPPDFKGRGTATWRGKGWALTGAFNYVSSGWDNTSVPRVQVASWSTIDARVSYDFDTAPWRWLHGLKGSLAVTNLFNRAPPSVRGSATAYAGLGYDSTNASALGRFISVSVSKRWR